MVKLVPVKKISQLKLNKEKTAAEELEFLTWIIFHALRFGHYLIIQFLGFMGE